MPHNQQKTQQSVTILGAGIAGATLAWHLAPHVEEIFIIDRHESCAGDASGNPAALVMPILGQLKDPAVAFLFHSFIHACDFYSQNNQNFWHQNGLEMQISAHKQTDLFTDKIWQNFLQKKSQDSVFIKTAGWLYPRQAASFMLSDANKFCSIKYLHAEIKTIEKHNENWQAIAETGEIISSTKNIILACGAYGLNFSNSANTPLHKVRGQITTVSNLENENLPENSSAFCRSGYALPIAEKQWLFGASFIRNDSSEEIRLSEEEKVLSEWMDLFPQILNHKNNRKSRASIRAMTSDRLPIIGAAISANQSIKKHANDIFAPNLIPGFWLFTGLGARGLTTVPLLAKIFLDEFLGEEKFSKNLIPEKIKNHVSSTRFLKRKWQRS
jgi:tRNA 5-methylaminomethyl-2-thiouridine biosynthesis bifunctional protein